LEGNMDIYHLLDKIKKSGKIEKGINEVTKAVERGIAKLVVYAEDVDPKEIVQFLPLLCKEKGVVCKSVDSKKKLGLSVGLSVGSSAVVVVDVGDAEKELKSLK